MDQRAINNKALDVAYLCDPKRSEMTRAKVHEFVNNWHHTVPDVFANRPQNQSTVY